MAKTKGNIKQEIKTAVAGTRSFEQMVDAIAAYIVRNYKLKKVTIVSKTISTESLVNKD